jgi:membrane peptidoglycan carboxypeptidase
MVKTDPSDITYNNFHFNLERKMVKVQQPYNMFTLLTGMIVLLFAFISTVTIPLVWVLNQAVKEYDTIMAVDNIEKLFEVKLMEPSLIVALDETNKEHIIGVFYDQNRVIVEGETIPDIILKAAVASEDNNFYTHNGVDIKGIVRAATANYTNARVVQGGSSITQQYVKNVFVQQSEWLADDERNEAYQQAIEDSLTRKFREARYAIALEKKMSKEEIITNYLNIVGFGGQIYGITAAADYYFSKTLKQLTLAETATLIGIINAPESLRIDRPSGEKNNQTDGYVETKERRDYVLNQMFKMGYITETEYYENVNKSVQPKINKTLSGCGITDWASYFCEYVVADIKLHPYFGETPEERFTNFRRGGYKIISTINMEAQQNARTTIQENVPAYLENINIGAGVVSVESNTGNIIVMHQNTNHTTRTEAEQGYTSINFNGDKQHGGSTGFPTGSTFKLFTLVEWLKTEKRLSTAVTGENNYRRMKHSCLALKDDEVSDGFWRGNYTLYNSGENEDSTYERDPETGEILINPETGEQIKKPLLVSSVLAATSASYNTIYVSMAQKLDLCNIAETAEKMGHARADGNPIMSDPAMVIGVNETAPLHVASAYSVISNDGFKCSPKSINKIVDIRSSQTLHEEKPNCVKVLDKEITDAVSYALTRAGTSGTGSPSNPRDGIAVGIKTGTSDDAYHTWVAGYTTETATAVWVGNVEGFTSLSRISYNRTQGNLIRHKLFKTIQTNINEIFEGEPKFDAPERKYL